MLFRSRFTSLGLTGSFDSCSDPTCNGKVTAAAAFLYIAPISQFIATGLVIPGGVLRGRHDGWRRISTGQPQRDGKTFIIAGGVVFAVTALLLFSTSALYHTVEEPGLKLRMRRLEAEVVVAVTVRIEDGDVAGGDALLGQTPHGVVGLERSVDDAHHHALHGKRWKQRPGQPPAAVRCVNRTRPRERPWHFGTAEAEEV